MGTSRRSNPSRPATSGENRQSSRAGASRDHEPGSHEGTAVRDSCAARPRRPRSAQRRRSHRRERLRDAREAPEARRWVVPGGYGSTNGTYVGGQRLIAERRLEGAPDVRFGGVKWFSASKISRARRRRAAHAPSPASTGRNFVNPRLPRSNAFPLPLPRVLRRPGIHPHVRACLGGFGALSCSPLSRRSLSSC